MPFSPFGDKISAIIMATLLCVVRCFAVCFSQAKVFCILSYNSVRLAQTANKSRRSVPVALLVALLSSRASSIARNLALSAPDLNHSNAAPDMVSEIYRQGLCARA